MDQYGSTWPSRRWRLVLLLWFTLWRYLEWCRGLLNHPWYEFRQLNWKRYRETLFMINEGSKYLLLCLSSVNTYSCVSSVHWVSFNVSLILPLVLSLKPSYEDLWCKNLWYNEGTEESVTSSLYIKVWESVNNVLINNFGIYNLSWCTRIKWLVSVNKIF